jgi:RecB family exonuclease
VAALPAVAGLTLKLRLDRVDRLNDGSLLVIDYKSGSVSPKSWELPRPEDVQLPLYAAFALPSGNELGGLVFARVRPGDMCFTGKAADAQATIDASLKRTSRLVKNALTADELSEWKLAIEQLARDFIAGRADVDPRDYPDTCDRCGLYALCRIREREDQAEPEEEENGMEVSDE